MSDKKKGRNANGRFAPGNPGGPGRPRRAIERDYLAVLSEAVTLNDWKEVISATLEAAKQGDAKARDWLARYLIGEKPLSLTDLAADEASGVGVEGDILARMIQHIKSRNFDLAFNSDELFEARRQLASYARELEKLEQLAQPVSQPVG